MFESSIIRARPDHDEVSADYLFYLFNSPFGKHLRDTITRQTSVSGITATDLRNLELPFPPLNVQKQIADILGTLDDKIDLNREMNRTFESMARAIFKSWFVDFDPVRAKQEGCAPNGIDAETAEMFPDRLVDSEMGEIPEGWEVAPMKEVVKVTPRYKLNEGDSAPYLEMSNCPTKGHYPVDWQMRDYHGSGSKFSNGDTLMAKITPCLENGKTAFVDFLPDDDTIGWGSTEYLVLRSKPPLPLEYSYYLARSEPLRQRCIKAMTGTSGRQRVRVSAFKSFKTVVPPEDIAQRFGDIVRDLMAKVRQNNEESDVLATMRDTLLPKLLSGELEVSDLETRE